MKKILISWALCVLICSGASLASLHAQTVSSPATPEQVASLMEQVNTLEAELQSVQATSNDDSSVADAQNLLDALKSVLQQMSAQESN